MSSPTSAAARMRTSRAWDSPWLPRYRTSSRSRSNGGAAKWGVRSMRIPLRTVTTLVTPRSRNVRAKPSVTVTTRSARFCTYSTALLITDLDPPRTREASSAKLGHASRISTTSGSPLNRATSKADPSNGNDGAVTTTASWRPVATPRSTEPAAPITWLASLQILLSPSSRCGTR